MNHFKTVFSIFLLVSIAMLSTNCGGDDDPETSEEEIQLDKLKAAQWTLLSASDGSDRTAEYAGMTLTFSGSYSAGGTYNYTSTATTWPVKSPWEKDGTWKFVSGSVGNKIVRLSDDEEMIYTLSNSDKQLSISFDYTGSGFENGRVESVEGAWVFTFIRP